MDKGLSDQVIRRVSRSTIDADSSNPIEKRLENLGFRVVETGGGCTAWWKTNKDATFEILVTDDGSHELTAEGFEVGDVAVGVYELEDGVLNDSPVEFQYFYSEESLNRWITEAMFTWIAKVTQ